MNDSPEIKVVIITPYEIKITSLFKYRYIVCYLQNKYWEDFQKRLNGKYEFKCFMRPKKMTQSGFQGPVILQNSK